MTLSLFDSFFSPIDSISVKIINQANFIKLGTGVTAEDRRLYKPPFLGNLRSTEEERHIIDQEGSVW